MSRDPNELVEIVLPRCANVFGSAPCVATGKQCYNTRATCKDTANYRDTPDRGLTIDQEYRNDESGNYTPFLNLFEDGNGDPSEQSFISVKSEISHDCTGNIWHYGTFSDPFGFTPERGAYFGVTDGNLIFRVGDMAAETSSGAMVISVDAAQFYGRTITFYMDIDWVPSGPSEINLWAFDPVDRVVTRLGADTLSSAGSGFYYSGSAGNLGDDVTYSGASFLDISQFPGHVSALRIYHNQTAPANMEGEFSQSLWLGKGKLGEPADEQYIFPCLSNASPVGTLINLSGADRNYRPLGRQATLDFSARDFAHSDITQDPYLNDRGAEPKGTFWPRWIARQKFGKVGARVRRHIGYAGEPLSSYETTSYTLERASTSEDGASFYCRDEFARTDFSKAQSPKESGLTLREAATAADTSLFLVYDETFRFVRTPGVLRINDEIITFAEHYIQTEDVDGTQVSYIEISGLTRGDYETDAADHDAEDVVQRCLVYDDTSVDDAIHDLLIVDAGIEAQFVDIQGLRAMADADLAPYSLNGIITEPMSINDLLGRVSVECGFYLWWDERAQQIKFQAIRGIDAGSIVRTVTYEDNIIAGSFKVTEKEQQRLNVITFYYNPISRTGDLAKPSNYKNAKQIINGDTSTGETYGDFVQERAVFSLFLESAAEVNQTAARIAQRYADIPMRAEFYLDAKDRDLWVGDIIQISHPSIVDADGSRDIRRWIIVEAEEARPGHTMRYAAMDVTLDGLVYKIPPDDIGDYAPESFAQGYMFITDESGLNPDGTQGATIA